MWTLVFSNRTLAMAREGIEPAGGAGKALTLSRAVGGGVILTFPQNVLQTVAANPDVVVTYGSSPYER